MGLQFRRSIKIAPGIRINFGKKSTSVSVGPRGAKVTMGTNGTHVSAGIPGTGIYYREKVSGKGNKPNIQSRQMQQGVPERTKGENTTYGVIFAIIAIACFLGAVFASLQSIGRVLIGGIGAFALLCCVMFLTVKGSDKNVEKHRLVPNPVAFVLGLLIIIGCIVIYFWSIGWEWTGHSKTNIYIRYDFNWLKYILYPILIFVGIIGAMITKLGLKDKK